MARKKPFLFKAGEKRLDRFLAALESAARSPREEAVHDLRVAIRRMLAFLRLAEALPGGEPLPFPRALSDDLEALMRPLGRLRDAHVRALRLRAYAPPGDRVTWQFALAVRADVEKWEAAVLKALKRARRTDFPEAFRALPLSASPAEDLEDAAMARLRAREAEATRLADAFLRLSTPESLHELRLGFKRYRYTAEALAPLLPGLTDETGARLHQFQTLLGDVHDLDVLLESFLRFRSRVLGIPPGDKPALASRLEIERASALESILSILHSGNGIRDLFAPR